MSAEAGADTGIALLAETMGPATLRRAHRCVRTTSVHATSYARVCEAPQAARLMFSCNFRASRWAGCWEGWRTVRT